MTGMATLNLDAWIHCRRFSLQKSLEACALLGRDRDHIAGQLEMLSQLEALLIATAPEEDGSIDDEGRDPEGDRPVGEAETGGS